ncbi:MAG TPA: hypothetical protein PLU67_02625 [Candidatus Kapabacteria bacterium]|nr:hypothetical protein [Candidatus Kapabacteria bacterium]HPP38676.1 hypothetical protein [Candidatus Kapabacteria bacterium]
MYIQLVKIENGRPQRVIVPIAELIREEKPVGVIDGNNKVFEASEEMVEASVEVFLNGLRLVREDHFAVNGKIITLSEAPIAGDDLIVKYIKEV